jgi:hypothetical protein
MSQSESVERRKILLWEDPDGSCHFTIQYISFLCHLTYPAATFLHSSSLSFLSPLNILLPSPSQATACTRASDKSL